MPRRPRILKPKFTALPEEIQTEQIEKTKQLPCWYSSRSDGSSLFTDITSNVCK